MTMARESLAKISGELAVAGLTAPVEVIRDTWGVPHIYAQNQDDLFFAQGYVMAQDRLWQMELWRRGVEGRMAEILGPQAVDRDRTAGVLRAGRLVSAGRGAPGGGDLVQTDQAQEDRSHVVISFASPRTARDNPWKSRS